MSKKRLEPSLQEKIKRLRLPLAPLHRLPEGSAHPAFPRTFLAYHLLTEEQLDHLAHFYHQSTPCFWTEKYPTSVLWPRRLSRETPGPLRRRSTAVRRHSSRLASPMALGPAIESQSSAYDDIFSNLILNAACASNPSKVLRRWSVILSDDQERLAIKRRKFGKFIGLVNMDTPAAEMESRMQHDLERSIRALRRERHRREQEEMSQSKIR